MPPYPLLINRFERLRARYYHSPKRTKGSNQEYPLAAPSPISLIEGPTISQSTIHLYDIANTFSRQKRRGRRSKNDILNYGARNRDVSMQNPAKRPPKTIHPRPYLSWSCSSSARPKSLPHFCNSFPLCAPFSS